MKLTKSIKYKDYSDINPTIGLINLMRGVIAIALFCKKFLQVYHYFLSFYQKSRLELKDKLLCRSKFENLSEYREQMRVHLSIGKHHISYIDCE